MLRNRCWIIQSIRREILFYNNKSPDHSWRTSRIYPHVFLSHTHHLFDWWKSYCRLVVTCHWHVKSRFSSIAWSDITLMDCVCACVYHGRIYESVGVFSCISGGWQRENDSHQSRKMLHKYLPGCHTATVILLWVTLSALQLKGMPLLTSAARSQPLFTVYQFSKK